MAKNVVAAGFADRCEVQFAYAIGHPNPVSIHIDTFGTNKIEEEKIESAVKDVFSFKPADIITMTEGPQERDHVLLVHQVDYQNFKPTTIHYTHSIAWPSDGVYGTGVRQGTIDILDIKKPITEQSWSEAGKISSGKDANTQENYTFARALKARTEIRRMLSL